MEKREFEALTGLRVTDAQYQKIERIYTGAPNIDKKQFCGEFQEFRLGESETVEDLAEESERRALRIRNLEHALDQQREISRLRGAELETAGAEIKMLMEEVTVLRGIKTQFGAVLLEKKLDEQAIAILGHGAVIGMKCSMGCDLTDADRLFLAETFGKGTEGAVKGCAGA